MIRFGPAGNSNSFYEQGNKSTEQMPRWVNQLGLNAFEYSFGRGINIGAPKAAKIKEQADIYGVQMSVHAPYYINFASPDAEKIQNTYGYVFKSIETLKAFGGSRCVFHTGSNSREGAFGTALKNIEGLLKIIEAQKTDGIRLCPEAMGKMGQLGSVEEVAKICSLSDIFIPCLDFGHINSRGQGVLKNKDEYRKVLDFMFKRAGKLKTQNMHIHFSKIQYGKSGEIRHLTFADNEYGPEFEPLIELIKEYKMTPVIICESDGTMAEDALVMMKYYNSL
jgi:deoxyribonuclease-4